MIPSSSCTETQIAHLEALINTSANHDANYLAMSQLKSGFAHYSRILIYINDEAFHSNLGSVIAHYCPPLL